jgi:acetyl-CoA acetyltransferase
MNARCDPFFTRDLGMDDAVADALFAQAVTDELEIGEDELTDRVVAGHRRAAANPRGVRRAIPDREDVGRSPYESTPLRTLHRAPFSDGAACLVLASGSWLARHRDHRPLARIAGVGWASDSYRLDRDRLASLGSVRSAWACALGRAGDAVAPDVVELECPTVFHEAAYTRAFHLDDGIVSPSGGSFAQNPITATGLVNVVEAVLQVSGRAGPVQRAGVRRAVAHGCHGAAQQGNVVVVVDAIEDRSDG